MTLTACTLLPDRVLIATDAATWIASSGERYSRAHKALLIPGALIAGRGTIDLLRRAFASIAGSGLRGDDLLRNLSAFGREATAEAVDARGPAALGGNIELVGASYSPARGRMAAVWWSDRFGFEQCVGETRLAPTPLSWSAGCAPIPTAPHDLESMERFAVACHASMVRDARPMTGGALTLFELRADGSALMRDATDLDDLDDTTTTAGMTPALPQGAVHA